MRMKFQTAAAALLLTTGMVHSQESDPRLIGPMPPDPVTVNRVAGPLTPASIAVWQLTSSPSDFLWRLLQATETLTTPQLRTLALDLLRAGRFEDQDSPQDWLMLSAWADREPAAAAREVLGLADWEDRDDQIRDSDSDVESLGVWFWKILADQDFPAALAIAGNLPDGETNELFFNELEDWEGAPSFTREQAIEWVKLAEGAENPAFASRFAAVLVTRLAGQYGVQTAEDFVGQLPAGLRDEAAAHLHFMVRTNRLRPVKPPKPMTGPMDVRLAKLVGLHSGKSDSAFPFAQNRAVRAIPQMEAQELAGLISDPNRPSGWLHWCLAMQAGQAVLDLKPPFSDQFSEESQPSTLYRPELAGVRALMERGDYVAALAAGAGLDKTPGPSADLLSVSGGIMRVWALRDLPAAMACLAREQNKTRRETYADSLRWAIHRFPYAEVLPSLDPALVYGLDLWAWWVYLPFEDREAGFRYFEKHAGVLQSEADMFLATVVRFEPARAVALARQRQAVQYIAIGLARHWPDRIGGLLKPEDGKEVWNAVAVIMAHSHPEKVIAVLEAQPFQEAWDEAGRILNGRPELMKAITPGCQ